MVEGSGDRPASGSRSGRDAPRRQERKRLPL